MPRRLVTLGVAVIRAFEIAKGNNEAGEAAFWLYALNEMNCNSYENSESVFISYERTL
jgi:hypothetical protein